MLPELMALDFFEEHRGWIKISSWLRLVLMSETSFLCSMPEKIRKAIPGGGTGIASPAAIGLPNDTG